MDQQTREFLLAEFNAAWHQVRNIDTRRGTFFNFYNLTFGAVLAFAGALWARTPDVAVPTKIVVTAALLLTIFMGAAVTAVLLSERDANVRYRKWINLLRRMFLSGNVDPEIQSYLSQYRDLGIKTHHVSDPAEICKLGRTLVSILRIVKLEMVALVALIAWVWVG